MEKARDQMAYELVNNPYFNSEPNKTPYLIWVNYGEQTVKEQQSSQKEVIKRHSIYGRFERTAVWELKHVEGQPLNKSKLYAADYAKNLHNFPTTLVGDMSVTCFDPNNPSLQYVESRYCPFGCWVLEHVYRDYKGNERVIESTRMHAWFKWGRWGIKTKVL